MQCLTRMGRLATLELDVSHWLPRPVGSSQRVFALELRTACPSLRAIAFWGGADRWMWDWEPQPEAGGEGGGGAEGGVEAWRSTWSQPQHPLGSSLWKTA